MFTQAHAAVSLREIFAFGNGNIFGIGQHRILCGLTDQLSKGFS